MKKILALLLVVFTLVAQLTMITVSAAGPTVTVATVSAAAGETVSVSVELADCGPFTDLSLEFGYDSNALTLLSITNGISGIKPTAAKVITTNPYNIAWNSADPVEYNGTIVTLNFQVNAEAESGTYPISVDYYKGRNNNFKDGVNCNFNIDEDFNKTPLGLNYVGGGITVAPKEYKLSATVSATATLGVDITAQGPSMSGKIIAALYDGKALAQVRIYDAAATVNATFTESGDSVKVMWWDGMLTAKPLYNSVLVPIN